jgi:hypothetical protein
VSIINSECLIEHCKYAFSRRSELSSLDISKRIRTVADKIRPLIVQRLATSGPLGQYCSLCMLSLFNRPPRKETRSSLLEESRLATRARSMPPDSDSVIISQYVGEELIPPASREQTNCFDLPLAPFGFLRLFVGLPCSTFPAFSEILESRTCARHFVPPSLFTGPDSPLYPHSPAPLSPPNPLLAPSFLAPFLSSSFSSLLPQSANSRSRKSPAKLNERT